MNTSLPAPSILPATAVLEMTSRCNHACLFCSCPWYEESGKWKVENGKLEQPRLSAQDSAEGGKDNFQLSTFHFQLSEMPISEWKDLIAIYARAGVMNFSFTGGEALLKDGLAELIAFAAEVSARHIETVDGELRAWDAPPALNLLSNGKIVTDDTLDMCVKYNVALSLSLPGAETFEEHTRGGQNAEHVLATFRRAKEKGLSTTAGITVTAKNFHELANTIAISLIAGADRILLNRFMPGGRGLAHRDLELTLDQVRQIPVIAEQVLRKANRYGHIGTELPRCLVNPNDTTHLKVGTQCSAATDFFVVGPTGMLRVCNHSPIDLVHWRDYDALRDHPYWRKFVHKNWTPAGCEGCSSLGHDCDGGCREAAHVCNGSPDAADPVFRGAAPMKR